MGLFSRNSGSTLTPARTINLTKDTAGTPAVDLTKVRAAGHIDLAKRADKAGLALSKRGLAGIRAQAMLVLDHSGSMHADYASGAVQTLVERALGFALQIDVDGHVPIIPFDNRLLPTVTVGVDADPPHEVLAYPGVVNAAIWRGRDMGSTDLARALDVVLEEARTATTPIYCAVVTDGNPDREKPVTDLVCELSRYPVFLKFLALKPVPYLTNLDDLDNTVRLVDNVNAQPRTGSRLDLLSCSDLEFAEAMADEWDEWVAAATTAGVLT